MKSVVLLIFFMTTCGYAESTLDLRLEELRKEHCLEEQLYYIAEAPPSLLELWAHTPEHFTVKENIKQHDNSLLSKWRELYKEVLFDSLGANSEMYGIVHELKKNGIQVGLLTNIEKNMR